MLPRFPFRRITISLLLLAACAGPNAHASLKPKTILLNKAAFHYLDKGAGDPVVFVHGSLGDYRTWEHQVGPFAKHYRVIAYSRRYHYPNRWSAGARDSLTTHVNDLLALVSSLRLGRVHLVGTSSGALVALLAALRNPAVVRTLTLGEPTAFSLLQGREDSLAKAFQRATYGPAGRALAEKQMKRGVRLFLDGLLGQEGAFDRLPPALRKSLMQNAPALSLEMASIRNVPPVRCADLRSASFPILLLSGKHSPQIFHRITEALARCSPSSERVTLDRSSHGLEFQSAQEFNTSVLTFIANH